MNAPLALATGPSLRIWQELAEEADRYANLMRDWNIEIVVKGNESAREHLEDQLYSSLIHLATHARVMEETIDRATDLEDDLEELEDREHTPVG